MYKEYTEMYVTVDWIFSSLLNSYVDVPNHNWLFEDRAYEECMEV